MANNEQLGDEREVTVRRTLEQVVHCAQEALSIVENTEDGRCAVDDLLQARDLIDVAVSAIRKGRPYVTRG